MNKVLFHFDWTGHLLEKASAERDANRIMRTIQNNGILQTKTDRFFNDIAHYRFLLSQEGCMRVDLKKVVCEYNRYVMGVQCVYRSTFRDGTTAESTAENEPHFFHGGWKAFNKSRRLTSILEIDVEGGEYLVDVRTNQGYIVDKVIFVTNKREVSYGGMEGEKEEARRPDLARRVVAFAGKEHGMFRLLERLGFFAVYLSNWERAKPLILLRSLVEKGRADLPPCPDQMYSNEDLMVRALVMQIDDDTFKHVISFLLSP